MQTSIAWLAVLTGLVAGGLAGWGIRLLLGSLRRGVVLAPGILELSAAIVTGAGVGLSWPGPTVPLVVWAGLLGVALGAVDIARHRLPDALTLPAFPVTVLIVSATEFAAPATGSVLVGLVVCVTLTGLFGVVAIVAPRAMGLGDVKLVPSLALLTGYVSVAASVLAVVIAFVLAAAVAAVGLLLRRLTLTSAIPFGPFLLAGGWLVLAVPSLVTVVVG